MAVACGLVALFAWWNPWGWGLPRLGWAGTEQAGWIAGIIGSVVALAALVDEFIARRVKPGPSPVPRGAVVRVGRVPQQAAWFQSRPAGAELSRAARAGRTAVLTQVLSGMGGVGKTQLAAEFARRLEQDREVDVLVWVTASSRDAIVARYAEAARSVGAALVGDGDDEAAASRFVSWLERTSKRWLVVLDNLDSPGDAADWWLPNNRNGRTVVTTRRRDPVLHTDGRVLVDVDVFSPDNAVDYLDGAIGAGGDQDDDLAALAVDLGYLPLALAQAAAFIRDRGLDPAAYRARLTDRRKSLIELVPPDDALPDGHRATVAATWSLSIDVADSHPPARLARHVLNLAAVLDSNGIPEAVFAADAAVAYLANRSGRDDLTRDEVRDALRNLHRLSLLTHDPHTGVIRVHAIVQRVTRDALGSVLLTAVAQTAADALLALWPAVDRDHDTTQILRANTASLRTAAGDALYHPNAHPLLFRAINSLGCTGQVQYAAAALEQLLTGMSRLLGPDHPDILATRGYLARWWGEAGDPAGAAVAFEQLLTDRLRVLGPDHPDTLTTRHNLAYSQGKAGDPAGAAVAFEQLLTDRLRVLGPDHPDTLTTRHNLAYSQGKAGDPAGAAVAFEQLLTDRLRVLGPDHPDTLATRGYLARWWGEAGDPAGAAVAFEQLLTDRLRVLGPDHPDTLATRGNLARWWGEAGDPAGAAVAFEQLLTDVSRVLDPDHPHTLVTRGNLARWWGEAGDPAGAAVAFEQLLTDRLRVLGPDHPHTLATRGSLAYWRQQNDTN
ncbi:FxSxx-COOH system tetratricopeptide repeat protein [Solwaraspora sp. WMMA2080]|uniref:FxSxx-COOH system tetratricopeptide repeat protein n=1 Tax=unclassified Solwaraspora TaxID=2627926 RepID=UPI00248C7823|nr:MULTISPECIES: FxSxx-COOH system tetratricopeptide repeat protein [unclassified Solwaraspora]WBB95265.1 FxSxx-COOH system tetratricopeptide repeat protein [Solwaraspora sp. WMMA2059]WBC20829.1 FxSxx-COOH system tetratricopeptide repeat protein [Solwaraspora sp. WMMA2080]